LEEIAMLLKDACMPDVVYCGPDTNVTEAAHLMRRKHVGDLIIVEDPQGERIPLGVITDRDLVVEVLARDLDPATTKLVDIMRTPVVLAAETEDTAQAVERMRAHGVRRIPVVGESGALVGVITLDDLLRQFSADATALLDVVVKGQSHEHRARR
jgi:CBS domain-containing protein